MIDSAKLILLVEDDPDHELLTIRALKKSNIANDIRVARGGEPVRQATALVPGPAQDSDHEIGDILGHNR